jgi:hypothetical protein
MNVNIFCYIFNQTSKSLTLTITKTQGNKKTEGLADMYSIALITLEHAAALEHKLACT